MTSYFVGADFGQARDYSTIALVERTELRGSWDAALYAYRKEVEMRVRTLERLPLGTPYGEVAERVAAVTRSRMLGGRVELIADATGVGRPVMELLRAARPAGTLKQVVVTTGEQTTRAGDFYHVPKLELIVGLQVAIEGGQIKIARGLKEGETLARELAAMEVRVTAGGREQYGTWRQGMHDDLVFAVALAWWGAREASGGRGDTHWVNRREAEMAEAFGEAMKGLREG